MIPSDATMVVLPSCNTTIFYVQTESENCICNNVQILISRIVYRIPLCLLRICPAIHLTVDKKRFPLSSQCIEFFILCPQVV